MGTGVRENPAAGGENPDCVAAVSVGVLWGDRRRETRPELLPVTEIGIALTEVVNGEAIITRRELLQDQDIALAPEHLLDLNIPIVTYNAPRFDWVALGSIVDVDELIPRTIDIHSAIYPSVSEIVDAEGASAFPVSGDYGVLHPHRLAETNLGYVPGGSDDAIGDAELAAALWHHFMTFERAVVAGRTHVLEDRSLALLRGEQPAFADAAAWRAALADRPEPEPYRRRDRNQITFPRVDQRYV